MGPVLFTLYSAPIYDIIKVHGLECMIYADDVQVYFTFPSKEREAAVRRINNCIKDIISWSTENKLIVNASKTEVIHFKSRFAPSPSQPLVVIVDGVNIQAVTKVRNLGVIMDMHLTMSDQITKVRRSAIIGIRKIGQIRQYLNRKALETLVHSLVISHVDNCNVLLYGLPQNRYKSCSENPECSCEATAGTQISPIPSDPH